MALLELKEQHPMQKKVNSTGTYNSEVQHDKETEKVINLKEKKGKLDKDTLITTGMVLLQSKEILIWKAPGPDGFQGYWIRN